MSKKSKKYSYNLEVMPSGSLSIEADKTAVMVPPDFALPMASDLIRAWLLTHLTLNWKTEQVKHMGEVDEARYGTLRCQVHEDKLRPGSYCAEVQIDSCYSDWQRGLESREAARQAIPIVLASLFDSMIRGEHI